MTEQARLASFKRSLFGLGSALVGKIKMPCLPAGILCLQSHQLSKKDQERLAEALQQRALQACPDPALRMPGTAVLWLGAPDDAIAEQTRVIIWPAILLDLSLHQDSESPSGTPSLED